MLLEDVRAKQAGLPAHSFRATGITNFLENDDTLEAAQRIAGHADSRTTKLYDGGVVVGIAVGEKLTQAYNASANSALLNFFGGGLSASSYGSIRFSLPFLTPVMQSSFFL